jgi:hypothetical protein
VRSRTSDGADFIVPGTDVPLPLVRLIGLLEVTGALGLILPGVTHIAPVVVGVAALFLGAILFHMRRGEDRFIGMHVVVVVLAVVVAWGRLDSYPLS